jgi:hypothetical protein
MSVSVILISKSLNSSRMQLICGQCDRHLVVEAREGIQWARCDRCEHEIFIGHLLDAAQPVPAVTYTDQGECFVVAAQRTLQERLLVVCSQCRVKMRVTRRMAGQAVRCLSCNEDIQIPELHEDVAVSLSSPLGRSVYMDELEAERQADRIASRRRQKKVASRRRRKDMLVTTVVVLLILAGVGLLVYRWIGETTKAETETQTPIDPLDTVDLTTEDLPFDPTPVPAPTTKPATRPSTPAPRLAQATARLTAGKRSLFAHGTKFPAASGKMYLLLDVKLQAGGVPISIHTDNVRVKVRGRSYPSIGLPVTTGEFPRRAQPTDLALAAGTSKTWQLLFEVPAVSASAEVIVGPLPVLRLKLSPFPAYEGKMAGEYTEVLPRRLKPLLTDPVMAAIQLAPGGPMHISKNGDKYQLLLPHAGVTSEPFSIANGKASVVLTRGEKPLVATLQYIPPQGNMLVLSLDIAPLHQLVFRHITVRTTPGTAADPTGEVIMERIETQPAKKKADSPSNIKFFGTSTK